MKGKKFSLFISIVLLVITALYCVACGESDVQPFGTLAFYDNAVEWVKEDFRNENLLRGVSYIDDNSENKLPQTRTFIVREQDRFEEIFVDSIEELNIDFNSEMILVYTFTSIYIAPAKIDISIDDSITITYQFQLKAGTGSATNPFQRWFVVVIDKEDYSSVIFEEKLS